MEVVKFDKMKKTWRQIARYDDGETSPAFELDIYKKMLNIFHVGTFYYYIVNIARVEIEFVSDAVTNVLGLKKADDFTVEYIFNNMHPDDIPRFALYEEKVAAFFNDLPPEKVLNYKVSYDYRLRRYDGKYVWILMQTTTIQSNEKGAVIRVLGVQTDITHLKNNDTPSGLSFIGLEGEKSYYNVNINERILLPSKEIFSKREKQVLRLMVEGKSTIEIADILFLSIHTVNSHRKQVLTKSGCKTNVELGYKIIKEGWI